MSDLIDSLTRIRDAVDDLITHEKNKLPAPSPPVVVVAEPVPPVTVDTTAGLTRVSAPNGRYLSHQYPNRVPYNSAYTAMVLKHSGGRMALHEGNGKFYDYLPGTMHSSNIVWHQSNPNIFYMNRENGVWSFDVGDSWGNQPKLVRRFVEFNNITIGQGEGDISEDGDFLPICADDKTKAFLYRLSTDTAGPPYPIPGIDATYVSPDNHLLITGQDLGIHMVSEKGNPFVPIVKRSGHMDTGRDPKDNSEMVVWLDDTVNIPTMVSLGNPAHRVPLLKIGLDWLLACHICVPQGADYVIVSPYAPGGEPVLYHDSILKIPRDGSGQVKVVARHKSDTSSGTSVDRYEAQPKACVADGHLVFNAREDGEYVVYIGKV